jgi:Integrase core domain
MLTADSNKKFVLCITDAFTKYAVVTSIQNKNAETVADAIFKEWFCKFGIPAQIHTDGGKEFVKRLSAEMMELMNVSHTKTSPAHPQCNSQVEIFNSEKIFGFIHGRNGSKLGDIFTSTGAKLQYQLPLNNSHHAIQTTFWRKSTAPILPK